MQGVPIPRDELPAEVWQLLPANCTIRHDEEFLYLYQFEVLVLALNKRGDGAALARLLKIAEQLWPGLMRSNFGSFSRVVYLEGQAGE